MRQQNTKNAKGGEYFFKALYRLLDKGQLHSVIYHSILYVNQLYSEVKQMNPLAYLGISNYQDILQTATISVTVTLLHALKHLK